MSSISHAPTRSRNQTQSTKWTAEEDKQLCQYVSQNPTLSWCTLVPYFPGKTAQQIAGRWEKVLNPNLIKGSWTADEDQIILSFVEKNGPKDWYKLAKLLPGRIGKQCRERWTNHLSPSVTKKSWSSEEDHKLVQLHEKYGNQWTLIATFFEGRTDNCVKNRWNSSLKRRIERIAKGEPEFKKRGRKPKEKLCVQEQKRESEANSECESPSPMFAPIAINVFSISTFNDDRFSKINEIKSLSLEQNRLDFVNLIMKNRILY